MTVHLNALVWFLLAKEQFHRIIRLNIFRFLLSGEEGEREREEGMRREKREICLEAITSHNDHCGEFYFPIFVNGNT